LLQWIVAPISAVPLVSVTVAARRIVSPSARAVSTAGESPTQLTPTLPTVSAAGAGAPINPYDRAKVKMETAAVPAERAAAMTFTAVLMCPFTIGFGIRHSDAAELLRVTTGQSDQPAPAHAVASRRA